MIFDPFGPTIDQVRNAEQISFSAYSPSTVFTKEAAEGMIGTETLFEGKPVRIVAAEAQDDGGLRLTIARVP